jgi:hypothetical protein
MQGIDHHIAESKYAKMFEVNELGNLENSLKSPW